MDLAIHTSFPQIGIQSENSMIKIKSHLEFALKNTLPELHLEPASSKLDINWEKTRYDLGMKSLKQLYKDQLSRNLEAGLNAIKKIAQEGDWLSQIEKHDAKIIAQIARNNYTDPFLNSNIKLIPQNPPEIDVYEEKVKVEVKEAEIEVIKKDIFPERKADKGYLHIYLLQKGGVEIEYTGNNFDITV